MENAPGWEEAKTYYPDRRREGQGGFGNGQLAPCSDDASRRQHRYKRKHVENEIALVVACQRRQHKRKEPELGEAPLTAPLFLAVSWQETTGWLTLLHFLFVGFTLHSILSLKKDSTSAVAWCMLVLM